VSYQSLTFNPDYTYELSFDLAGSQRPGWGTLINTATVSLGSIYNQEIALDDMEPFQTFQYAFEVTSPICTSLTFDHWGGDWVGLLLDNVQITSTPVPEPSTILLSGPGFVGLLGFGREFTKRLRRP
jgi:hypothetical protein